MSKSVYFQGLKKNLNFEAGNETGVITASIDDGHYLEQAEKSNIVADVMNAVKKHEKNSEFPIAREVIKSVEKYNKEYLTEFTEYATEVAGVEMGKKKDVQRAVVKSSWGTARGSNAAVTIDRSKESRNPKTKEITSAPNIRAVVTDRSCKVPKSFMGEQKELLASSYLK